MESLRLGPISHDGVIYRLAMAVSYVVNPRPFPTSFGSARSCQTSGHGFLLLCSKFYSTPLTFSPSLVLIKHSLPAGSWYLHSNALTRFLINLTLNELWAARNRHTFEGQLSTPHGVIATIKQRVRTRIREAYNFTPPQEFVSS